MLVDARFDQESRALQIMLVLVQHSFLWRVSMPEWYGSWEGRGLFWRRFTCRITHGCDKLGITVRILSYVTDSHLCPSYERLGGPGWEERPTVKRVVEGCPTVKREVGKSRNIRQQ